MISYQIFAISVFCSEIVTPKISLIYANPTVKWFFWIFYTTSRKHTYIYRGLSINPGLGTFGALANSAVQDQTTCDVWLVSAILLKLQVLRVKWKSLKSPFRTIFSAYTRRQLTNQCCQCFDFCARTWRAQSAAHLTADPVVASSNPSLTAVEIDREIISTIISPHHYKNTPIQICWKFYQQKWKFSDKISDIFFIFLLKTLTVGTR